MVSQSTGGAGVGAGKCPATEGRIHGVGKSRKPFLGFHGRDVSKDPSSRGARSSLNPVGACDRAARRPSIPERHAADSRGKT